MWLRIAFSTFLKKLILIILICLSIVPASHSTGCKFKPYFWSQQYIQSWLQLWLVTFFVHLDVILTNHDDIEIKHFTYNKCYKNNDLHKSDSIGSVHPICLHLPNKEHQCIYYYHKLFSIFLRHEKTFLLLSILFSFSYYSFILDSMKLILYISISGKIYTMCEQLLDKSYVCK